MKSAVRFGTFFLFCMLCMAIFIRFTWTGSAEKIPQRPTCQNMDELRVQMKVDSRFAVVVRGIRVVAHYSPEIDGQPLDEWNDTGKVSTFRTSAQTSRSEYGEETVYYVRSRSNVLIKYLGYIWKPSTRPGSINILIQDADGDTWMIIDGSEHPLN